MSWKPRATPTSSPKRPDGARGMAIATPLIDAVTAGYQAAADSLPGGRQVEVTSRRQMALDAFRRHGLPDHRLESWQFTSLSGLGQQARSEERSVGKESGR